MVLSPSTPLHNAAIGKFNGMIPQPLTIYSESCVTTDVGMCGKPKFGSHSVLKTKLYKKFDIHSDGFPI